jgi:hypothetical protein
MHVAAIGEVPQQFGIWVRHMFAVKPEMDLIRQANEPERGTERKNAVAEFSPYGTSQRHP